MLLKRMFLRMALPQTPGSTCSPGKASPNTGWPWKAKCHFKFANASCHHFWGQTKALERAVPRVRRDKVRTQDEIWHLKSLLRYPDASCTRLAGTPRHRLPLALCATQRQATPSVFLQLQLGSPAAPCPTSTTVRKTAGAALCLFFSGQKLQPSVDTGLPGLHRELAGWKTAPDCTASKEKRVGKTPWRSFTLVPHPQGKISFSSSFSAGWEIDKNKETKLQGIGAG